MMAWFARVLLFIPSLIAGWFVAREDARFWVIAMVIALVFLALSCIVGIYAPSLRPWPRERSRPPDADRKGKPPTNRVDDANLS
ncbi:hypothetical protein KNJ79_09115 [Sphingopyxis indica]|uniref:hypothetical protein n=1 Tax=Sphingopyxis indica TaxID=436663 RepID=UPI0029391D85|nr:hypothetical protein [Sphingopyxis indica]WOF45571.1 hypothetical protein KNJ79_09115 [Sphingopyxis indica]